MGQQRSKGCRFTRGSSGLNAAGSQGAAGLGGGRSTKGGRVVGQQVKGEDSRSRRRKVLGKDRSLTLSHRLTPKAIQYVHLIHHLLRANYCKCYLIFHAFCSGFVYLNPYFSCCKPPWTTINIPKQFNIQYQIGSSSVK